MCSSNLAWLAFITLILPTRSPAAPSSHLESLVAHLAFDGALDDSTGRGNRGAMVGTVQFEDGRVAKAAFRTPTSDGGNYVTLGNPADLQFGHDVDFTITTWFRPDSSIGEWHIAVSQVLSSASKQGIAIVAGAGGGVGSYAVSLNPAGKPPVNLVQPPQSWKPGQWRHLALSVRRQQSARFFIDGVLVATASLAGSDGDLSPAVGRSLNLFQDGAGAAAKSSGAAMDDMGIWRRALSDEEVAQVFACGSDGTHLGLAGPSCTSPARGGGLDNFFNPGSGPGNGSVGALMFQDDGRLLVGGQFWAFDGISRGNIVRLMPDGTVDTSFWGPTMSIEGFVRQICLQRDGKLLIVGKYTGVMRLLPNGREDSAFNDNSWRLWRTIDFWTKEGADISAVAVQADGKVLAAGDVDTADRTPVRGMVRLNPDGTLDTRFLPEARNVQRIVPTKQGIYLFGFFTSINGQKRLGVARLHYDGSLDFNYNRNGSGPMRSSGFSSIYDAVVLSDGSAIVAGVAGDAGTHPFRGLARYTPNGEWDPTFAPEFTGGQSTIYSIALVPGPKLMVGGHFDAVNGRGMGRLVRLMMDGSVDPEFRTELKAGIKDHAKAVAVRCDGMVAVAGPFTFIGGAPRTQIAQFQPDDPKVARLCAPTTQSDGNRIIASAVQPGKMYELQSSSDLTSWRLELIRRAKSTLHLWSTTHSPTHQARFYRLIESNSPNESTPPNEVVSPDEGTPPGEITPILPAMVAIQPGSFLMGSPASEPGRRPNEGPQAMVTFSTNYWLGKFEVTQREYQNVMGTNPSFFGGELDLPVDQVSWDDATNYCGRLTARELAAGRLPAGYEYRLPTEAQWEFACRAGTTTATAYGSSLSSTQANFSGDLPYNGGTPGPYLRRTTKVGGYAANAWGLHDMHGNVEEWCLDSMKVHPGGSDPTLTVIFRVLRGGSYSSDGQGCRSARRWGAFPETRSDGIGFRIALVPVQ